MLASCIIRKTKFLPNPKRNDSNFQHFKKRNGSFGISFLKRQIQTLSSNLTFSFPSKSNFVFSILLS